MNSIPNDSCCGGVWLPLLSVCLKKKKCWALMDWISWQLKDCTDTPLMLSDFVLPHANKVSNVFLWLCAHQISNTCILQTNNHEQHAFLITREVYQQIYDFRTTVVLCQASFRFVYSGQHESLLHSSNNSLQGPVLTNIILPLLQCCLGIWNKTFWRLERLTFYLRLKAGEIGNNVWKPQEHPV